jgi:hypothetical protein
LIDSDDRAVYHIIERPLLTTVAFTISWWRRIVLVNASDVVPVDVVQG